MYKRSLQTIPYRLYSRKNSIGSLLMTLKEYTESRAKLQIHLLKRGVYIAIYNNRYTLLEVLFDIL